MKYERRNNIGLLALIGGSAALICGLLFFPLGSLLSFLVIGVGIAACLYGLYLMTRSFSKEDVDHPDYAKWKARQEEIERQRERQ